jgi:hypothetical protein
MVSHPLQRCISMEFHFSRCGTILVQMMRQCNKTFALQQVLDGLPAPRA